MPWKHDGRCWPKSSEADPRRLFANLNISLLRNDDLKFDRDHDGQQHLYVWSDYFRPSWLVPAPGLVGASVSGSSGFDGDDGDTKPNINIALCNSTPYEKGNLKSKTLKFALAEDDDHADQQDIDTQGNNAMFWVNPSDDAPRRAADFHARSRGAHNALEAASGFFIFVRVQRICSQPNSSKRQEFECRNRNFHPRAQPCGWCGQRLCRVFDVLYFLYSWSPLMLCVFCTSGPRVLF